MEASQSKLIDLIRSAPVGTDLLSDPVGFIQCNPTVLLHHRSRSPNISEGAQEEIQRDIANARHFATRKRYALKLNDTTEGPICLKLRRLKTWERLVFRNHAARESQRHHKTAKAGFAAATQLGHAQFTSSANQIWQVFGQSLVPNQWPSGEVLLAKEPASRIASIATELARLHDASLVHGDLKPYHVVLKPDAEHWLYLDLEPMTFRVSYRSRITNLYQGLRYFLDGATDLVPHLVDHYLSKSRSGHRFQASTLVSDVLTRYRSKLENGRDQPT